MQFEPGEINIICTNLEASLRFYCDVLGFHPTNDGEGFYHLQSGNRQYLLLPIASQPAESKPYGQVPQFSMDLMVADIEAAYQHCQQHNVTFAKDWQPGAVMFIIRDPDGLAWEIIQKGLD